MNKQKFKNCLKRLTSLAGICFVVEGLWEWIDTLQFGAPQPSVADGLACLFIVCILYYILYNKAESVPAEVLHNDR